MKLYNLGSLNIDYVYQVDRFVKPGETLASDDMRIFPGGKGLNQSIALARAGAQVVHGAVLGSDGEFLLRTMEASGVDTSRIAKTEYPSGHAIIQVDKSGQNSILLFSGTNSRVDRAYVEKFLADAQEGDILLLQYEISCMDVIFEVAHEKKMQIAFNPSPYTPGIKELPLHYVSWWFCNEIEGEAMFGGKTPQQITENFVKQYPNSNLILTLGQDGSLYKNAETCIMQPICPVKAVDTTAAGDTFTGYFMASVAKGETAAEAMDLAARAASVTVSRLGAAESIPYMSDLQKG